MSRNNMTRSEMDDERKRRQNRRNLAVFLALLGFVVLVYAVTVTKIKMGYGP